MTDRVKRLIDAAQALIDSVIFDEIGLMVGGKWQGGNGGLISAKTIQRTDEVRRAIAALEQEAGHGSV